MAKKGIWTTLAGLAVAGAAVGGAVAYLKKSREAKEPGEEEFDDLDDLNGECSSCAMERTYTTLPTEGQEKNEETAGTDAEGGSQKTAPESETEDETSAWDGDTAGSRTEEGEAQPDKSPDEVHEEARQ